VALIGENDLAAANALDAAAAPDDLTAPNAPDDPVRAATQAALHYLNRRDRTVSETRRHLAHRGFEAAAIEAAVHTVVSDGFLDDARYARLFAEDKRKLNQWGAGRIRRALLERGIDRDLVDRALSSHTTHEELQQAVALLKRRFVAPPVTRNERNRALGLLLRRGYDDELALQALTEYARERSATG
jgi:regulatory protein